MIHYVKTADDPTFYYVVGDEITPITDTAMLYEYGLHPIHTISTDELAELLEKVATNDDPDN
jgi:hypothetical protein